MEQQFESNSKFKEQLLGLASCKMRHEAIGRDIKGRKYWFFMVSCF